MKSTRNAAVPRHNQTCPPDRPVEVSVVIVTYESEEDVVACLRSVLASSLALEVIVVDNASRDRTVERVRGLIADVDNCRLLCNAENTGFARAANQGMRHATGGTVLLLNPDCVLTPNTINEAVAALRDEPEAALAGCMLLNEDGSEQAGARRHIPTPWRALVRVLNLQRLFPGRRWAHGFVLAGQPVPRYTVEVAATSGAFLLVRREAI